jgi:isoleucyl-tRNA synthetase
LLAPIIPHTAEEVYSFLNIPNKQESIFLHDHKFELSDINGKVNNEK